MQIERNLGASTIFNRNFKRSIRRHHIMHSFGTCRTHKRQAEVYSQSKRREEALTKLRDERTKLRDNLRRLQLDEIDQASKVRPRRERLTLEDTLLQEVWSHQEERTLNEHLTQGLSLIETTSADDPSSQVSGRREKRVPLMQPLWMIEPPPDLASNWLVMARPEGKRCLVQASKGNTVSRLKTGAILHSACSALPGGSRVTEGPTVLDCIFHEANQTYYLVDLLCWNGVWVKDCEAVFRLHWVQSKLLECQPLSSDTPFQFEAVRWYACDRAGLLDALYDFVPFERDGICLLHKAGLYTEGPSELSLLWKDLTCSRYLVETDSEGTPLEHQRVILRLEADGGLYTGDDPPVLFSDLASCSLGALKNPAQLTPERLLKFQLVGESTTGPRLEFVGFDRKRDRAADLFSKIRFQKYAREGSVRSLELIQAVEAQIGAAAMNPKPKREMIYSGESLEREAFKSEMDPETGKLRCLSCGSVFRSRSALADHLRKHGGINATSYKPRKVVGTSHGVFRQNPVERPPDVQLSDLVTDALPTQSPADPPSESPPRGKREPKEEKTRRRAKMTPTKRTIMIHQVLSLTQNLATLHQDYASVMDSKWHNVENRSPVEIKKQMKKIQGCMNSVAAELQTVLTAVNRKFTFRQLVMVEYLANQMEHLETDSSGTIVASSSEMHDDVCNFETQSLDTHLLELYSEAERVEHKLEASRAAEADSLRHIEKRRDSESGKIFIKKPVFVEPSTPQILSQSRTQSDLENKESEMVARQETTPQKADQDRKGVEAEHFYLSSLETSSDDSHEMWGFSDVLTEWVKQTQHNSKNKTPIIPHTFQKAMKLPEPPKSPQNPEAAHKELHAEISGGGISVIRASKTGEQTSRQKQNAQDKARMEDRSSDMGQGEPPQPRCIFIRPHVAEIDDTGGVPASRHVPKKSTQSKKRQGPSPGASSAENRVAEAPLKLDDAVHQLLTELNSRQHEDMKANNGQRWIVSGFAEVCRHLSRGCVKLIVVANNLDPTIQPKIAQLQMDAEKHQVPLVQALTRKKIGQIYHYRKRMSVVGVLNYEDLQTPFETVLRLSGADVMAPTPSLAESHSENRGSEQ